MGRLSCALALCSLVSAASCVSWPFGGGTAARRRPIDDKLRHYELVRGDGVERTRRHRRHADDDATVQRDQQIRFHALGREFRLYVRPRAGLLDAHFRAMTVNDSASQSAPLRIDAESFLAGRVFGQRRSSVKLTVDEEFGAMLGHIVMDDGLIIMLEPAWLHLDGVPKSSTLVYRADHLRPPEGPKVPFCGAMQPPNVPDNSFDNDDGQLAGRRKRQAQTYPKRMCPLKMVADYRFFRDIGDSRTTYTVRYLINLIDRVNDIYLGTDWASSERGGDAAEGGGGPAATGDGGESDMSGFGFSIREIVVKDEPTLFDRHHYNHPNDERTVENLLTAFTRSEGSSHFCLVHLFTSRSFTGGVLGLSYIASRTLGTGGGICSAALGGSSAGGGRVWYNTGLSTLKSTYGDSVITREADIVTAHELGHNWGSVHDPQTGECSPPGVKGGSYIMHTFSVAGYDSNNKMFSPCSKRFVLEVLRKKSQFCFEEPQESYCGNQRVERGEQCDSGFSDHGDAAAPDACCHRCTLRIDAKCSPANSVCCTADCQYASGSKQCVPKNQNACHEAAYCVANGTCPAKPPPVADGTKCLDGGTCRAGRCVPYCVSIGRLPCICEDPADSCYRCCRTAGAECTPVERSDEHTLRAGTRCIHGYCDQQGTCKKEVADVIEHLWRIFEGLDSGTFWIFIQTHLVAIVVFITALLWIPASVLVCYVDRKRMKEREQQFTDPFGPSSAASTGKLDVVRELKSINYNPVAVHL